MSNTVITNYTDLNGPSSKTDSSVVVIVNKDGSLSVDQKLLGTLMGSDGSQTAGISVVRVGHEGRPDDATDSESEDDKMPHVTLSVDSYYDEPNSIIKYDSGAEMLQSLRIETRENSLVGFHNDHCYTPLKSPSETIPHISDSYKGFDNPVIEITHNPPPKPIENSKKITILEQQIIPKGKKIILNPLDATIILKGKDVLNKPLPVINKSKDSAEVQKKSLIETRTEENTESSSVCSSGDSTADRDSDSDYKDAKNKSIAFKLRKTKTKPRILKSVPLTRGIKPESKIISRLKTGKNLMKKEIKEKSLSKVITVEKSQPELETSTLKQNSTANVEVPSVPIVSDQNKLTPKPIQKVVKKEKKTPAHMSALLSDMTSLFSTPDVIRRISTDNKTPSKIEKDPNIGNKKVSNASVINKDNEEIEEKPLLDVSKPLENSEKAKNKLVTNLKQKEKIVTLDKSAKNYDLIPHLDDASLAQILEDTTPQPMKTQPSIPTASVINSPGLAGPLSPTLDLLGGLQPEEDGLTEDLLMHVAQLVESSENLQEVIDKQVLGKVDSTPVKTQIASPFQQPQMQLPMQSQQPQSIHPVNVFPHHSIKTGKTLTARKDPIEIVRRDGRIITLPPIEAPATRASKRKSQVDVSSVHVDSGITTPATIPTIPIIEPVVQQPARQYTNKKLANKKHEPPIQPLGMLTVEKISAESQESWNSEDDPNRLWCICKQPHNNRFMICCDGCEDWFHGKCVNITKAMGQQMEEQGIEWRCPNCKGDKAKNLNKSLVIQTTSELERRPSLTKDSSSKTTCIVCKKLARASSIYCSDACILKHAQDSLGSQVSPNKVDGLGGKTTEKHSDSRVIVYERKSGRLLAGPNAPTADNLKSWLQKNPTFEVVRPGTLSTIKPNLSRKKSAGDSNKIQTTLNFTRLPRNSSEQLTLTPKNVPEMKQKITKPMLSPKEEGRLTPVPKTPTTPKPLTLKLLETPKAATKITSSKVMSEPKKTARAVKTPTNERAPSASPTTSRRKDSHERRTKMNSVEPIRDNVRKSLQEQMGIRMAESDGPKFTEEEIQQFAYDTEYELHELFSRDVGMKYKAKYRSLMFNIKDRKNLTLWEKICDRSITPRQLVRLSAEELASQELAQWRDKEAKHQLELIKKSELDLLAANKTYVLKTHKGEEVMQNKESVSTELDPNVPVEDVVMALNDSVAEESSSKMETPDTKSSSSNKKSSNRKKDKDGSRHSKRESKRDREKRKSRSSKRRSDLKEKEDRSTRKSRKKSNRTRSRSESKERTKKESSKEKSLSREHSRNRSRSRVKSKRHSKEHSRSNSRVRERSRSSERSKRRSRSKDSTRQSLRSRSKQRVSTDEKKLRSRSQDAVSTKTKNDSTDSDSLERPKSATLKEVHPEYDPHEPMITSAISEEDLRKSREDVYEENYKNEIGEFGDTGSYDPPKAFSIDTDVIMPTNPYVNKQEKVSEAESDQEPSSTVESSSATVWNGCINMVDVARFYVAAHEVSGNAVDLEEDLSTELDIVGRINPETVWEYISKMKRAGNKDIVVLRLQAANDEEMMQYIALYSYLSSRNRLGVVKVTNTATVKDFYIVPLQANTSLPSVLLPFDGPGLGDVKTHLLVAIIIRQRKKRTAPPIPKAIVPAKVARSSRKRSYTPPKASKTLPLPATYSTPVLSITAKDKIVAAHGSKHEDEPYSPGSSSSGTSTPAPAVIPPPGNMLRSKMEELNRQIEEQKQQILKMARADTSIEEDEAYSPSRPMTPSPPAIVPLADIALPSNLQEILATIKQRTENPTGDVDMRQLI